MLSKTFYINLGNLLYSIYRGDSLSKIMEEKEFFKRIKNRIVPNEEVSDEFGTNNSYYCIFELERLMDDHQDPYQTFANFEQYYKQNFRVFNRRIKSEIDNLIHELGREIPASSKKIFCHRYEKLSYQMASH